MTLRGARGTLEPPSLAARDQFGNGEMPGPECPKENHRDEVDEDVAVCTVDALRYDARRSPK
jgi:hypothetical protein